MTKRPPPEDGVGGWGSMRRGAPRFRDDCMELFTMGDSRSGIRTVASDKEAINILEAQDGTLLGRICWSYHEPVVTTILCGDPWEWIGFLISDF